MTSGLAFAGAVVGGGMAAGIAVVSAPVAIVGVTAYAYARRREHLKLLEEKRELLKEALIRREALLKSSGEWGRGNGNLHAHLIGLKARLDECIAHLRQDLGQSG